MLSRDRLLLRTISDFFKARKESNNGALDPVGLNPEDMNHPDYWLNHRDANPAAGECPGGECGRGDLGEPDLSWCYAAGAEAWPNVVDADQPDAPAASGESAQLVGIVQEPVTALGGWGRRPQDDAPRSEASTLGAIWLCQLDPRHPTSVTESSYGCAEVLV